MDEAGIARVAKFYDGASERHEYGTVRSVGDMQTPSAQNIA